jgi:RHS repeat-associated protein
LFETIGKILSLAIFRPLVNNAFIIIFGRSHRMVRKFLSSISAILARAIESLSFMQISATIRDEHKELVEWTMDWQLSILLCLVPEQLMRLGKQAVVVLIAVLVVLSSFAQAQLSGEGLLLVVGLLATLAMGAAAVWLLKSPALMDRPQPSLMVGLFCLALFLSAGSVGAFAQSQPNTENGTKPYGSYDGGSLDTVNTMNGNLLLHAPLLPDYPQRGKITPHYNLYVTSKGWQVMCKPASNRSGQVCWWQGGATGVSLQTSVGLTVHRTLNKSANGGTVTYQAYGYTVTGADAASHQVYGIPGTADANGEPTKFETTDTSGLHLELGNPDSNGIFNSFTVTDRQGDQYFGGFTAAHCGRPAVNRIASPSGFAPIVDDSPFGDQYCSQYGFAKTVTDSNGNQMVLGGPGSAVSPPTDTLGKAPPLNGWTSVTDYSNCVSSLPINAAFLVNYSAGDGSTQAIKLCYANIPIQTAFSQTGVLQDPSSVGGTPASQQQVVTVILADGTKWAFSYDSYANLIYVGLPTGGSISYTWTEISFPTCNPIDHTAVSRAVASRTVTDGNGNSFTWHYNWGTGSAAGMTNVVTDSLGNDTAHGFTALENTANFSGGCGFYETRTQSYQGSSSTGKLLKQVETTYSSAAVQTDISGSGLSNVAPTSIKTTIYPSGKVSLVTKTYDTGLGTNAPIFGNVVTEKVYDWGQGAPGALLRETDTSYVWQSDARYLTAHLLDLPASVVTKDGSGNRVAETDYVYDESQYLTAASINTQHIAPPNAVRGNLTTVSHWLNPSNSMVSSHTNWYDTGEVFQQIDPLGNTTTHSYDAAYVGAYSTKTQDALGHVVSGTYDFNTGLLTSFTNANATAQASGNTPGDSAHTSNYVYDFMSRMISATLPADAAGNHPQTTFNYPDATTVERLHTITASLTSSLTDDAFTYFDGLGRAVRSKHVTGGNALVDTAYDALGRAATVTNPYFSTNDLTYGFTQSQYDALGRVTQVTKQDGGISTVSYSDNCTTTTDEAGKQRRTCVDGAGRLAEVDETGDSFPGSQATGGLAITGSLQSKSGVGAIGATKASASVTINGTNQVIPGSPAPPCDPGTICDNTPNPPLYDSGKVYIVVNGHEYDYFYGYSGNSPDSASSVAQGLVNAIQADAGRVVNASVPSNGTTITLTAVSAGSAGNVAFSSGSAYDRADFSSPSFTLSPASGNLSGGTDSYAGITVYDAGTVTATIGSFTASVNYGPSSNSTAQQLAAALASALSVSSSPVTASASGTNITITYKTIGTSGNAAVTVNSSTSQSSYFSSPSFASTGTALSGGFNPQGPSLDHAFYVTLYFYDALGNLLCVEQHGNVAGTGCSAPASSDGNSPWRVRRFTYDSLSRLLTAHNPESGLITYQYDNGGNLLSKTSPVANQPVGSTQTTTISYCYDALNRITGKAYGAQSCPLSSPVVTYAYDQGTNGIGHLTHVTDQAGTASYSYDILGRMASGQRTIAGVTKNMSYTYNLDGSVATVKYPSGATITYTPDSAGRMLKAVDSGNNINYVTGATYGPHNALTGFVSGQRSGFNGITNTTVYDVRLQPCRMTASSIGAVPTNCDNSWGELLDLRYDFHLGSGDDGNVYGITHYGHQTRNQTFTYDALNRLTSAQNAGTDCTVTLPDGHTEYWGNSYSYDAWGNLLGKSVTKCSAENLSLTAAANNQLQNGYTYDAAGNMTHDATANLNYSYDPENRVTGAAGYTYTYDADGNRVEKASGTTGTLYWYMSLGIVGESDLAGALKSEYVFFDGERVARRDLSGGSVSYYFSDHLKTASVITDSGGTIKSESDYYPWGGELQFANNDSNHYKFTGKERDSETGLDYFGARYYANSLGRFVTSDWSSTPVPVPYADLHDPQSLNQYTYVRNIPTSTMDPDGHCCWDELRFLGQELVGVGKQLVNTATSSINAFTVANTNDWKRGPAFSQGPVPPQIPQLQADNLPQAVGMGVTMGATFVAPFAKGAAVPSTAEQLQAAANRAAQNVGSGSGAVHGTKVHTAFEAEVQGLRNSQLSTEQSYLNGEPVTRGTPGSVRVDVVEGPVDNPTAVYDLKTGNATLSPARVQQIQSHLPQAANGTKIPVREIKPR